jgi:hypothetical protein
VTPVVFLSDMRGPALLAPPIAFGIFLLLAVIIDRIGHTVAEDRPSPTDAFRSSWAGGEASEAASDRPTYRLFHVAIGFTIVHVAVLVLATVPRTAGGAMVALPLLAVVGLSLFALLDIGGPTSGS